MAHPTRLDWAVLLHSLQQADRLSHELLTLLDAERIHLQQRDYNAFEQLLASKGELLLGLQSNTIERLAWLQAQGIADDAEALARADKQMPELARQWRKLGELWRECQHASRVNDQIAQRTRTSVGRMLDALSGNAGQGSTYDGKGGTQRVQTARTITSA